MNSVLGFGKKTAKLTAKEKGRVKKQSFTPSSLSKDHVEMHINSVTYRVGSD